MDDPWGLHEPAAPHPEPPDPLPPQLAKLAALTAPHMVVDGEDWDSPGVEALPEVAALIEQGWRPVGSDPRYSLLPAVWPTELRCWLPDRMPKVYSSFDGQTVRIIPAGQSCHPGHPGHAADHSAELAAEAGLPIPPTGRIWLLRSPWPRVGLKMVLALLARRSDEGGRYESADFLAAARELLALDETRLREWWTGEEAEAATAWEAAGLVGEDVVELVHGGIGPDDFARLAGLTAEQAAAWRWAAAGESAQDAVNRAVFFRSLGLPSIPPPNLYRLHDLTEDDLRVWVDAGFDVPTMIGFAGVAVDQAVEWRQHGYSAAQMQDVLQADPTMTAAEVDAFAAAGIVGRHRLDWIVRGFGASEALAYDERDVQPNEARVWRSMGLGPADVPTGLHLPSGYQRGGWAMSAGTRMRDAEHSVRDPPGTRGALAEQSRHWRRAGRGRTDQA